MMDDTASQPPDTQPEAGLPAEFDDVVVWAAWLYYADQLTQNEIAKKLNVARATIVNYLRLARERGIVSIRLNPVANARTRLSRQVAERYGLQGALLIPSDGDDTLVARLGDAGARLLAERIRPGDVIGVAWGRTVLAAARTITLPEPMGDLTVVQVSGSSTGSPDFSAELCTSIMSSRIGARCVNLLAPAVLSSRALKEQLLAEPVLQRQFALIHSTNHIVFGVGEVGPGSTVRVSDIATQEQIDDYVARGAVAAVIGRFIDINGKPTPGTLDDRMVGISLEDLRKVPSRVCVAGGAKKLAAIHGALSGGYATYLVSDTATAEALLAHYPPLAERHIP